MDEPKLTPSQWKWLDKICRTNGGGVDVALTPPIPKAVLHLYDLGLVQGKSGCQWCAVHTRDGLSLWRKRNQEGTQ